MLRLRIRREKIRRKGRQFERTRKVATRSKMKKHEVTAEEEE